MTMTSSAQPDSQHNNSEALEVRPSTEIHPLHAATANINKE